MPTTASPGKARFADLQKALNACRIKPNGWNSPLSVIWGVTSKGVCVSGMTVDAFLAEAAMILHNSGRVYRYYDSVVMEAGTAGSRTLRLLASEGVAQPAAGNHLTNLFVVGVRGDGVESTCPTPSSLVKTLLASESAMARLPEIRLYFARPVFDEQYNLVGPGWNAGSGILIHGPDVSPVLPTTVPTPGATALDLLPTYTRGLLQGFCWEDDADLTNAVGALLTGMLANHFVDTPKPVFFTNANQPGVGKTLFWQATGTVLDGSPPRPLKLSGDEELEKKLSAILRTPTSSVILFDNQRGKIDSTVLEAGAPSPVVAQRILGQSAMVSRPNTFLWAITSNDGIATTDLISRGIPIRMRYAGDPSQRAFSTEDLLAYAREHRGEILGELAGLVARWNRQGRPHGPQKHRCGVWAKVGGGILGCVGLTRFLANVKEAAEEMDEGLQTLATLAEHVLARKRSEFYCEGPGGGAGQLPKEWVSVFGETEALRNQLFGIPTRGQATVVGKFLLGKTDRSVEVSLPGGPGRATLRRVQGRGNQNRYFFEIKRVEEMPFAVGGTESATEPTASTDAAMAATPATPEVAAATTTNATAPASSPLPAQPLDAAVGENQAPPRPPEPTEAGGNDLKWL